MSRSTPWRTTRRLYALHQGRAEWYRIRNLADTTQIHIYDEIGFFGVSANDFIKDLSEVSGPLDVRLNSPGGEVDDGIAIYNALLEREDVTVTIDSLAASIASVIAMAGKEVRIAPQAKMMVHDGFTMAIGNADDMRKLADHLDKTSGMIADIYARHAGNTSDYWRDVMRAETWYYGQEAVDAGLADRLVEAPGGHMPSGGGGGGGGADWDLAVYDHSVRNNAKNAASVPFVGTRESRHEPMTGRHAHDHASFGHDDHDDGMHYHVHEHSNDASHDHPHTAGMGHEGHESGSDTLAMIQVPILYADGHVEIWNWDAGAAMGRCHSASDYRSICAGERSTGEPDTAAHWALPHHNSPGAGPDKGGVVAALGRWNQTDGLKNKDAALSHLKGHARSLGLPSADDDKSPGSGVQNFWSELTDDQIRDALKGA